MFWALQVSIFVNFFKTFTTHIQHSIIFFFGQTPGSKWTVPNDFLAKKEQILFYEGLRPQLKKAFQY